jgi:predicted metal-binding membrane protein
MRNIFELTKREQRIVIVALVALVAFAFAKHVWETKFRPAPTRSTSSPTPEPSVHAEEEQSDDSR